MVEAVFLCVERAVALGDPAHIAGPVGSQHKATPGLGALAKELGDNPHRRDQSLLVAIGKRRQEIANRGMGSPVERLVGFSSGRG